VDTYNFTSSYQECEMFIKIDFYLKIKFIKMYSGTQCLPQIKHPS
jgi:hypothetical protein